MNTPLLQIILVLIRIPDVVSSDGQLWRFIPALFNTKYNITEWLKYPNGIKASPLVDIYKQGIEASQNITT